jgi:hypothetical protein
MARSIRRFRLPSTLFGLGAAALLAGSPCASAQGLSLPGDGAKLTLPANTAPAVAMPPAAETLPALPPVALPTQVKEVPAQAKDGSALAPVASGEVIEEAAPRSPWLDSPKPAFIPRPGFFAVPPTGPGYYSLLDALTGNYRETPPKFGYPRFALMFQGFFDTDWRYVDEPGYQPDLLERLHRIHIGDNWMVATGGEFRYKINNEVNSRLSGKDNNYDLSRLRVFGDIWYKDTFRIYAEFISAQSFNQDLAPLIVDRNYADIQNLFIDVKVFEDGSGVPYYVRAGRQEMLLGSQRLISTLDWANTRRTFDGVRAFRHSEKFDFDLFWTRLVIPNATSLDKSDPRQNFGGAFAEYRPTKTQAIDLYWLYLDNRDQFKLATKLPPTFGQLPTAPYSVHTFGFRYAGNVEGNKNILFDFEDMLQLGHSNFTNGSIVAGNSTTGLGYNFSKAPMNPTVWAYFDWASGSQNPLAGQMSTFNQLYPFNHYYFGWLDYVGRANIQDFNAHLYLYPTKWLTFNTQFHCFMLDSAHDALYNSGGSILRFDPTGKSGRDVGRELDLIANFHLTPRQDILAAYGHLWEGRFLRSTGSRNSAETFWLMYNVRW